MLASFIDLPDHDPVWIKSACEKLITNYEGKTENIWRDTKDAKIIIERFDDFDGISQKKSTMAVNFLVDYFKIPLTNWEKIDISVDLMVRRVFKRLGLVPESATDEEIIRKARVLMPSFPGDLDYATWDIGRYWCLPKNPYCYYKENGIEDNCPLVKECQSVKLFYSGHRSVKMNEEILSEIRNKLTAPKTALERLAKGENAPKNSSSWL